ncbi:acid phosphatase 1-like [Senna tora]|uniref:Acid phosphatase 1-like n=1 Tax=Senna tora TaxID=362788 RepID=A0A834TD14_9FABA|nr:acid phosphatase 1-like [Senna tora]
MDWGLWLMLVVLSTMALIPSISSESTIKLASERYISGNRKARVDDTLYCDSWRLAVETNNAGKWEEIPERCKELVEEYMSGERYVSDSEVVANFSLEFAKEVELGGKGRDAWVFDVDETLLSNFVYYTIYGFGSKKSNEISFEAPALAASLRLYKELQKLGFTIFLLTGRPENLRQETEANLLSAGYTNWNRLILRGPMDEDKTAETYKSEKRAELVKEGYILHGNSGDQWSDLLGQRNRMRRHHMRNIMGELR